MVTTKKMQLCPSPSYMHNIRGSQQLATIEDPSLQIVGASRCSPGMHKGL